MVFKFDGLYLTAYQQYVEPGGTIQVPTLRTVYGQSCHLRIFLQWKKAASVPFGSQDGQPPFLAASLIRPTTCPEGSPAPTTHFYPSQEVRQGTDKSSVSSQARLLGTSIAGCVARYNDLVSDLSCCRQKWASD